LEADARVARVKCLPRLDFERNPDREKAGHVTVTILPKANPEPDLPGLITAVKNYLTPRLLLTTRLHVIGPQFLTVGITTTVVPLPDAEEAPLKQAVVDAVKKFLNPLSGGDDADGWPFGRNVFISEIFSLIDQLPGVDYVTAVTLTSPTPGRRINNAAAELVGIEVRPYELVTAQMATTDVTVQTL